jgi:hypothetical protein
MAMAKKTTKRPKGETASKEADSSNAKTGIRSAIAKAIASSKNVKAVKIKFK